MRQGCAGGRGARAGRHNGFCTAAEGGAYLDVCEVVDYLGIRPAWFDSTDIGGAAFLSHAGHAALAIAAGLCEVVVVS